MSSIELAFVSFFIVLSVATHKCFFLLLEKLEHVAPWWRQILFIEKSIFWDLPRKDFYCKDTKCITWAWRQQTRRKIHKRTRMKTFCLLWDLSLWVEQTRKLSSTVLEARILWDQSNFFNIKSIKSFTEFRESYESFYIAFCFHPTCLIFAPNVCSCEHAKWETWFDLSLNWITRFERERKVSQWN